MTLRPPKVELSTVIQQLRELISQRATGTYYIVSSDTRQVRIGLVRGELDALSIRAPDVKTAFDALAELQIARTAFTADGLAVTGGNLKLSTEDLIHELSSRAGFSPASRKPPAALSLSAVQGNIIRSAVIEHLGPMGDFVYDEHREACSSLEALLGKLAGEIPDKRNADRFLHQVRAALKGAT